jgi:hypothetical protein
MKQTRVRIVINFEANFINLMYPWTSGNVA